MWNEFYARRYRIADLSNPLAILAELGQDAPGAFDFTTSPEPLAVPTSLVRVTEEEIGRELAILRTIPGGSLTRASLAGAQPKTAYLWREGAWWRPEGAAASTHILKPATQQAADTDILEHVLANTARMLGVDSVESSVLEFDGERAFVTRRYDRRLEADGTVTRLHQEDLCQALGLGRERKYQEHGGATAADLVKTVRELCPEDEEAVWRLLAFNVEIGNADAHAKNHSFRIDENGHRLAPAYDLMSLMIDGTTKNTWHHRIRGGGAPEFPSMQRNSSETPTLEGPTL